MQAETPCDNLHSLTQIAMQPNVANSAVTASIDSPATADGAALAVITLRSTSADALDHALDVLCLAPLAPGSVRLVNLLDIDRGVAIRWTPTLAHLTPHGSPLVARRLYEAILAIGVVAAPDIVDPRLSYPETDNLIEACALDAIANATSPRALDVIFRQQELWRRAAAEGRAVGFVDAPMDAALQRLLRPPTVVLLGSPNIGKSTLMNALARRPVSLVADEAGVTRDHVGVTLELDGLTLGLIDAPGLTFEAPQMSPIDSAAHDLALMAAGLADLAILCADAGSAMPDPASLPLHSPIPSLRVALRADLGRFPDAEIAVSAQTGKGLSELAKAIRQRLVSDPALATDRLWRFHPLLPILPDAG